MKYQTRLLLACLLAIAVMVSGCGKHSAKNAQSKKPGQAGSSQQAAASASGQEQGGADDLQSLIGFGPNMKDPLGLMSGNQASGQPLPDLGDAKPIAVQPLAPNARPEPKQLLLLVQNAYRAVGSMKVDYTSTTTIKQNGKVVVGGKSEAFSNSYRRPDKVAVSSQQMVMTCDGKNVTVYSPVSKQYATKPFTKDVMRQLVYSRPGVGSMGLLAGVDYSQSVTSCRLLNDAKVAGQDTYVLELKMSQPGAQGKSPGITQTLWVGKRDFLIYKNQVSVSAAGTPPGAKSPMTVEETMVSTVKSCSVNPALSDAVFSTAPPAGAKKAEAPKMVDLTGKPAPDMQFAWTDGSTKRLSDFRGKTTLLVFWRLPIPKEQMAALASACSTPNAQVVPINFNGKENQDKLKTELQKAGYGSVPLVFADEALAKVAKDQYGVLGMPSLYIIDKNGVVRAGGFGIPGAKDLSAAIKKSIPGG